MITVISTVLIVDQPARRFLAVRRLKSYAGLLALPGGKIEDGEQPDEAAHRELVEETGLFAPRMVLFDALKYQMAKDGVDKHYLNLVFVPIPYVTGNLAQPEPTKQEVLWSPFGETDQWLTDLRLLSRRHPGLLT